jgi:hypothetical protein
MERAMALRASLDSAGRAHGATPSPHDVDPTQGTNCVYLLAPYSALTMT